jgi:DNA-3-methyladenine glycosylase II
MFQNDPIMYALSSRYPPPVFIDKSERLFEKLCESIISQQLSVKAASTIWQRVCGLFIDSVPSPAEMYTVSANDLRSCGVSLQKITYLHSFSDAFLNGLISIDHIKYMSDQEVISCLTQIRGVGQWTAEMMCIFVLNRPDVFSIGDLGLRRAIEKLYGITDRTQMLALSETWKPYRSTACWYLWKAWEDKSKTVDI